MVRFDDSVFLATDDERGLHADYEKCLEGLRCSCPWCDDRYEDCIDLPEGVGACAHSHGFKRRLEGQVLWRLSARPAVRDRTP